MLVVRAGSLAGNVVAQLDKVLGELAKTANDHCNILPPIPYNIISAYTVLRGSLASKFLGVLYKVLLDALCPFFNRNVSLR